MVEQTDHFRLMRDFCAAPATFIEERWRKNSSSDIDAVAIGPKLAHIARTSG
jgi:hypothetical protein